MTSLADRIKQAKEGLDKDEQFIRLENIDDEFTMVVEGVKVIENEYGTYPLVTGTLEDGTPALFAAMRTAVNNRVTDLEPQRGDILSVRYLGEKHNDKSGRDFHAYKVVLIPGEQSAPAAVAAATAASGDEW